MVSKYDRTELIAALRELASRHVTTHYAECWRYHGACAMNVAADLIEEELL